VTSSGYLPISVSWDQCDVRSCPEKRMFSCSCHTEVWEPW